MRDWAHRVIARIVDVAARGGLWWGLGASVVLGVVTLAIAGAVVVSWPPDHFRAEGREPLWADRHPAVRVAGLVFKNLAGVVLLVLGFVMALPGVPGQGVLTMIVGLTLVDVPGKAALERRLIRRPIVLRTLNRLRARFRREPLALD
ncbi:MAG TPA: hypothetical protein VHJ20_14660 [Polyangia bacterium]|nr:hypothetical protein [Polyangia bacterium]